MGKIVVSEFVSLDGVIAYPHLWSLAYWGEDIAEFKGTELKAADALLLGRTTFDEFADAWPSRSGDWFAEKFNAMPKYVVSTTSDGSAWNNSHVIAGYDAQQIAALRGRHEGDVLVNGSATLVQQLVADGLVDQWNLIVYPVVLGEGLRLFAEGTARKLRLVESRPFASGPILSVYAPAEG